MAFFQRFWEFPNLALPSPGEGFSGICKLTAFLDGPLIPKSSQIVLMIQDFQIVLMIREFEIVPMSQEFQIVWMIQEF
jgi:hypothetical protein